VSGPPLLLEACGSSSALENYPRTLSSPELIDSIRKEQKWISKRYLSRDLWDVVSARLMSLRQTVD